MDDDDEEREDETALEIKLDEDKVLDELNALFDDECELDTADADELEDDDCAKNWASIVDMHESVRSNIWKPFLLDKENMLYWYRCVIFKIQQEKNNGVCLTNVVLCWIRGLLTDLECLRI